MNSSKNSPLKAGQSVICRVDSPEPGGYAATILSLEISAFLPSQESLETGSTVPATFVCMSNNRALMTFAYMLGTTERVQFGLPSEEETAFAVWADSYPRNFNVKRAVDVIMPGQNSDTKGTLDLSMTCGELQVEKLLAELESSRFNGCIKTESESRLSRAACLLYKGRAVGCIYGRKNQQTKAGVENALASMLEDLEYDDTKLIIYELPLASVVSMSSLFFGIPLTSFEPTSPPEKNALQLFDDLLLQLTSKLETACITTLDSSGMFDSLGFIYMGQRFGSFSVTAQEFSSQADTDDRASGVERLRQELLTGECQSFQAFLLPREMTSPSVLYGYSLAELMQRDPSSTTK